VVVPETPAPSKKVKQVRFTSSCRSTLLNDDQTDTELRNGRPTTKGKGKAKTKTKAKAMAVGITEGDKVSFASTISRCNGVFGSLRVSLSIA
jgi:hypothetical protein